MFCRSTFFLALIFLAVLTCAEAQSGTEQWNFTTAYLIDASPAVGTDGTIYVPSYENIYAMTPGGSNKWIYPPLSTTTIFPGIFGSPAIGPNGTIYFGGSADGVLYALDPATGTNKWTYSISGNGVFWTTPAIGPDGAIYIGSEKVMNNDTPYLYCINTNGTLRWRYAPASPIYSSAAISQDGATIYFGSDDGKLYALSTNGTTVRWTFNTGPKAITAAPAIGADGKIYIGVGSVLNPKFYCVNTNGTTNWVFTCTNRIQSSAAIGDDGTIYFGSDDMHVYALNTNGTLKWAAFTGATNGSSPAIAADGTIYIGSDDGKLYAFNSSGSNLWTFTTGAIIFSSPAIGTNGTVYVGSEDAKIYALNGSSGLARTPWPMLGHDVRHTAKYVAITNTLPTITAIANQTNNQNTVVGPLSFTVFDAETPAGNLLVSGVSSNTTLVPNAQLVFSGTGSNRFLTITPATNQAGKTLITVTVTDAAGGTNSANFLMTVLAANHAPVATNNSYNVNEDTVLNISAPGILGNDSDVDGDSLTAVLVSTVSHGTLTLTNNGGFTYTPTTNYNGSDSFTYKASDGQTNSSVATVTITINPVNDAPIATNDSYNVNEDTTLNISASGILSNDSDVDGDSLTAVLVSTVSHGTLTLTNNGGFTYTPTTNYNGSDSFTYKASDGQTNSSVATVTITINPVNDAPMLSPVADQTIDEKTALTFTNFASDVDSPPQTLTFSLVSAPTNAALNSASGVFTWTSTEAQGPGTNLITLAVTDNGSPPLSATQSFTVFVREVNLPPALSPVANLMVHQGTPVSFNFLATDPDIPTNTLTYTLANAPTGAGVNPTTGLFTWTPSANQVNTTNAIRAIVTDNGVPPLSATNSFTIAVFPPPLMLPPAFGSNGFIVTWSSIPQTSYRVQYKTNLDDTLWINLSGDVLATGYIASKTNSPATDSRRFYHIRVLP